ncbi:MAG: hypothetical protein KDD53_02905, partial [Bdellovibrionales bacterium]|nr:hypothetical protein [Bdellovibrionales bacterium]
AFLSLIFATEFLYPGIISDWLEAFSRPPFDWAVATLVGWVRLGLSDTNQMLPTWPIVVVPGLTTIVTLFWLIKRREVFKWETVFPLLILTSLCTAPYGWLFDQTLLIVPQTLALQRTNHKLRLLIAFCSLNFIAAMIFLSPNSFHHYFTWLPLAYLWVYLVFSSPNLDKH